MLKRIPIKIISLLSMLALAGCGGGSTSRSGKYGGESLIITMSENGYGRWMEDYAATFERQTGCAVLFNYDSNVNEAMTTLFASSSTEIADIYMADVTDKWYDWAIQGHLAEIKNFDDRVADVISKGNFGIYNGKRYTLNPWLSPYGIVYNQDKLNEVPSKGQYVQGEFPKTMQGLLDLCDAVNESDLKAPNGKKLKPLVYGGNKEELSMIFKCLWAQKDGGKEYTAYLNQNGTAPEEDCFINDAILNSLKGVRDILNVQTIDGRTAPYNTIDNCQELSNLVSEQKFLDGEALFCLSGGWFTSEKAKSITDKTFNYRFSGFPSFYEEDKTGILINSPAVSMFIPRRSPVVDIAQEFIEGLFSSENCTKLTKSLNTPMAFKYDFTDADYEILTPFGKDIFDNVDVYQPVMVKSNSVLCLYNQLVGSLKLANGSDFTSVFFNTNMVSRRYSDEQLEEVMRNNYSGYQATWADMRKNAGL